MDFDFKFLLIFTSLFALSFSVYNDPSQSRKFTWLRSLNISSESVACAVKYGAKTHFYYAHTSHVERSRRVALESALFEAMLRRMSTTQAAVHAVSAGMKAEKLARKRALTVTGPVASSWEFFEVLYHGGTVAEGFFTSLGTFFGARTGGFICNKMLGSFGYFVGSCVGNLVGGKIGLKVHMLLNFLEVEDKSEVHLNTTCIKNVAWYEYDRLVMKLPLPFTVDSNSTFVRYRQFMWFR